jgi:hypothetical protein
MEREEKHIVVCVWMHRLDMVAQLAMCCFATYQRISNLVEQTASQSGTKRKIWCQNSNEFWLKTRISVDN